MTNGVGAQASLPPHVVKYLQKNGVDPDDLSLEALETFASLTVSEVALLQAVGDSLGTVDTAIVAKVH